MQVRQSILADGEKMERLMKTTVTIDAHLLKEPMQTASQAVAATACCPTSDEYLKWSRSQKALALRGQLPISDNWREMRELEIGRDLHE